MLLTGDRDGYYAEFGEVGAPRQGATVARTSTTAATRRSAAGASARAPTTCRRERFVVFDQNHDQVGNRAFGDRLPPEARPLGALVHAAVAVHADALPGRGVRRARAVPVLRRPHRRGDRRGHARRAAARVRGLRGVRRRGGARPAGPGDVRALQAHARGRARGPARALRAPARGAPRDRARRGARVDFDEHQGWLRVRRGEHLVLANFSRDTGPRAGRARRRARARHAPRDGRARPRRPARRSRERWSDEPGGLARRALPARRDLGRQRHELLALLRARRARRAVPVRRRRQRAAGRADRAHRAHLARLPAGRRAGPALRLPRPRALRPGGRPSLQPGQAAARPVREVDRRAGARGTQANVLPYVADRPGRTPTSSATTRTTSTPSRSRS